MKPVVYIDVLFCINFLINAVLLYVTYFIGKWRVNVKRIVFSSIVGSIYACIVFFPHIGWLYSFFFKIVISALIVAVAFDVKSIRAVVKPFLLFYCVTFVFGGVVFFLSFATDITKTLGVVVSNGGVYFDLDIGTLIGSATVAYAFVYALFRIGKKQMTERENIKVLRIYYSGKYSEVNGLLDTGCKLTEPVTGIPVIVVEKKLVDSILDEKFNNKHLKIPYCVVNGENGVLKGFAPDYVVEIPQNRKTTRCIVAVTEHKLSANNSYNAIFNTDIFYREVNKSDKEYMGTAQ